MKNNENKALYLVLFLLGIGTEGLLAAFLHGRNGDDATWFSGIAALVAMIFVYFQIRADQQNWNNEHKSDISIEALLVPAYIQSAAGGYFERDDRDLKIWAVNKKYGAGSYRYVGICKREDYDLVKANHFEDPKKIFNKKESIYNMPDFKRYDTEERYEIIKGRGVSRTQTISEDDLRDTFGDTDNDSVDLIIIYVDPFNNPVTLEFQLPLKNN